MSLVAESRTFVNTLFEIISEIEEPLTTMLWSDYTVGDAAPMVAREIEQELWLLYVHLNSVRGGLNGEQLKFLSELIGQSSHPPRTATVDELKQGLSEYRVDEGNNLPVRILIALQRYDQEHNTDHGNAWKRFLLNVASAALGSNPKSEKFRVLWRQLSNVQVPDGAPALARNKHIVKELERALERIISQGPSKSSRPKAALIVSDETALNDAVEELSKLTGLNQLKDQVQQIIAAVKVQQQREAQGLSNPVVGRHLIFCGNPGTGKTMVARIMAKIFKALGVISKGQLIEVDRSGLVAEYVGQTAVKTRTAVEKALGGVLFIDEAYSLMNEVSDPFGHECIDTLVKMIEDNRDDLIVIAAGYTDRMNQFINANPGLKSRFGKQLVFEDYAANELVDIYKSLAREYEYELVPELVEKLPHYFQQLVQQKDEHFGNAREVRKIFEQSLSQQANRVSKLNKPTRAQLKQIMIEDVEPLFGTDAATGSLDEVHAELAGLIGLQSVKDDVESLINNIQVQKMREAQGLPVMSANNHLVFAGNPGTGKTTVARLLGKVYKELGLLSKGHFIEVDRARLVAGYLGQTAIKTKQQFDGALGGVLFIDEVYSLNNNERGADEFGQECIDTLVKLIEDHRDHVVVIIAGYPDKMNAFMESNPGLKSRFNKWLNFEDYNGDELFSIFERLCIQQSFILDEQAMVAVKKICADMYDRRDNNFGNGREIRNLFERVAKRQGDRIVKTIKNPTAMELRAITEEDLQIKAMK